MYLVMVAQDPEFLEQYLPYVLRRADQALSASFYEVLAEKGVGRSEWRVLAVLDDLGELSVLDLAEAALSPQPTVTHALKRLEERGLIRRTPGTDDKRNRFISITPAGAKLTQALIVDARRLETDALSTVGDLTQLVGDLRELTNAVEAMKNNELKMEP